MAGWGGGPATQKAEALLQAAVALDPKFAIAWSELAFIRGYLYFFNIDHTAECLDKANAAMDIAVRLAPDEPEVILNRGFHFLHGQRNFSLAAEHFEKLTRLQPNSVAPQSGLAAAQRNQGKFKESLEAYRNVAERDPGNFDFP